MKKAVFALVFAMLVACIVPGCGGDRGELRIAIVQQMDHASLDEIRAAIEARLGTLASEQGAELECRSFSGQNDPSVLTQICATVVTGGFDLVIPIGTLAAQYVLAAADGRVPVVYAAVSDPEGAGLTGHSFVTGISDALDTEFILELMLLLDPQVQRVGLLYSNSEVNSQRAVSEAKVYLEARGIEYLEKTGTAADEILACANSLVGRVDAVFTPTDNVVMGAQAAVGRILAEAGIPHYTGADSFVTAGAFAACGVNYTRLGEEAAELAMEVLSTGVVPPYRTMPGGIVTVNTGIARLLGMDMGILDRLEIPVRRVETGQ